MTADNQTTPTPTPVVTPTTPVTPAASTPTPPAVTTPGTDPEVSDHKTSGSADVQAAERAGLTEGDIHALRDDANLDHSAGHEANVHAWENSAQGQAWLADEDKRQKAIKDEVKAQEALLNEDGNNEATAKYLEAVEAGRS